MLRLAGAFVGASCAVASADANLLSDLKGMFGKPADPAAELKIPAAEQQQQQQQGMPAMQQQQQQPSEVQVNMSTQQDGNQMPTAQGGAQGQDMDLLCLQGPSAQQWFNIQQKARYIMPAEAAFAMLNKTDILEPALFSILEDMSLAGSKDECGVGKVIVQLLSILVNDVNGDLVGKQLSENEQLTSPIMTLLLDIPWSAYQPMWPLFGFLSQMAIRRVQANQNDLALDGLSSPELQQFAAALDLSIVQGNLGQINALTSAYLDTGDDGVREAPIAFITSLFGKAATAEKKEEAQEYFAVSQAVLKRMLFNPSDLDALMKTRWPLWGFAYLASLKTAF